MTVSDGCRLVVCECRKGYVTTDEFFEYAKVRGAAMPSSTAYHQRSG